MAAVEGAAAAEAPFNRLLVDNAFDKASGLMDRMCQNMEVIKDTFTDNAPDYCSNDSEGQQTEQLKAEVRKLIQLRAEAEAFRRAVQKVKADYQPTGKRTDFKALLKQHCDADEQLSSLQVDGSHPWLRQVDEALGSQAAAGPQELGSDEELQMEATTFLNATCPLTMLPLLEIKEPVEDGLGYVYEKAAILHHIGRSGGRAECPVGGTRHFITASNLVPSRKVQREQRRALLGRSTQLVSTQQQHDPADEVVLDAD